MRHFLDFEVKLVTFLGSYIRALRREVMLNAHWLTEPGRLREATERCATGSVAPKWDSNP